MIESMIYEDVSKTLECSCRTLSKVFYPTHLGHAVHLVKLNLVESLGIPGIASCRAIGFKKSYHAMCNTQLWQRNADSMT